MREPSNCGVASGRRSALGGHRRARRSRRDGFRADSAGALGLRSRRELGQAHGTLEANGLTAAGASQRAGRRREPMTKALSGAATKLPKSHVPASAAAPADAPPPRPAALAEEPGGAAAGRAPEGGGAG